MQMGDKLKEKSKHFIPTVRGSGGSIILSKAFCFHGLGPVFSLEGRVTANRYKTVLTDMMKHFYPYGSGLFSNDNAPINWA